MTNAHFLDELAAVIADRHQNPSDTSYTSRLFAKGTAKIAQKVGEEAVETVIEAMRGDREKLAEESADLLYHLLVLWQDAGLPPKAVYKALAARKN
jgi:phosphoribosyl-ATP pyrophosphohydrolase